MDLSQRYSLLYSFKCASSCSGIDLNFITIQLALRFLSCHCFLVFISLPVLSMTISLNPRLVLNRCVNISELPSVPLFMTHTHTRSLPVFACYINDSSPSHLSVTPADAANTVFDPLMHSPDPLSLSPSLLPPC